MNVVLALEPATPKVIIYVVSMTSDFEAKKPATKQATEHATCQVWTDRSWSIVQAQLLVKISDALKLKTIYITNYDALFHISRLVSKLGMVLVSDTDYQILLQCVTLIKKLDSIVYVNITKQAAHGDEKKNIEPKKNVDNLEDEDQPKKKIDMLPLLITHHFRLFV